MTVPVAVSAKQIEEALNAATKPGASDAATQQLGDKFKAMMDKPNMAAPSTHQNDGMNVVAAMAGQQDAQIQRAVSDTMTMQEQAPYMSMQEMNAATIRVTMEITGAQLDMEAKMGIVNSSKSAVETLMKNQ
ncbi:type III secretion protein HrpB2 [Trinickia sp. LjRoot230]|uniref:type III secretion protein HrpB2 n=1 Tax=Trinickia sp. LjRoot230 TaxID=3342288 RepID=UPI003ECEFB40